MDLHKIPVSEMRSFDKARLSDIRHQIQRELVKIRMDIYTARAQHAGKVRGLKKTLARLLTVTTEAMRASGGAVASKPAVATAKKAPAKKAAPKAAKTAGKATAKKSTKTK
jgi:ribosomal protein L29